MIIKLVTKGISEQLPLYGEQSNVSWHYGSNSVHSLFYRDWGME